MTIRQTFILGLVSVLWLLPAHALQIGGEEQGNTFREIYQDGYYLRLENDQLMLRYRKGKCLMASDQGDVYVEDSCAKIADEFSEAVSQKIAAMEQQYGVTMSAQSAELRKMMQAHEGEIELKKTGSGEVAGYDSTIFSAGASKYWVSPKLLSQIKKAIDYKQFLKAQQRFEAAFRKVERMGGGQDRTGRIEKDLEKKGYLMKKTDAASAPGMNPMMMGMLPPEKRKEIMAQMGEGPVVLNVTSVNSGDVDIQKIKPSGRKVTVAEYLEAMFRQ